MNALRQIVHILRKDLRAHWLEIGFLLLLQLAFVLFATESWRELAAPDGDFTGDAAELVLQIAIVVIWALLIVQVVQAETATGKSSYWLTRPLSRVAVPGAKAAFVLLVVHLPSFAAQMAIVVFSGVPLSVGRLLLNQVVFLAYWSLPILLVASLTRSLARFVLAVVITGAGVLLMQGGILGRANLPEFVSDLLDPIPVEIAAWMIVLAVVAGGAVFWHYRRRQTLIVAASCAAAVFLLFQVTAANPRTVEHWGRSLLQATPASGPAVSFRPSAERPVLSENYLTLRFPFVRVSLPLEISDVEGIRFERERVRIRTLAAPVRTFEALVWLRPGTGGYWIDFDVPQRFSETEVSVRIEFPFEHYESYASDEIPVDGRPGIVDGRLQCGAVPVRAGDSDHVLCRSTADVASGYLDRTARVAFITSSYLPFRFSMNPILSERIGSSTLPGGNAVTPLATEIRAPTGYGRRIVEIESLRLADWVPEERSPGLP